MTLYNQLKEDLTIGRFDIPEGECLEYYLHLQSINLFADNMSKSWVIYCQAKYYFEEKRQYSNSIKSLEDAICIFRG